MNDPNEPTRALPPASPGRGPAGNPMAANHTITPEEMRVLDECNRESFFQRSIPIGTALGVSTYLAVQRGILRPSLRFGAFPKVTVSVVIGYFIGKMSYQQRCAEKLMALPDSRLGQMLRDMRAGRAGGDPSKTLPSISMYGATKDDIYSDAGPGSSLNIDTDRPIFSSGDDTFEPSKNNSFPDELPSSKTSLTYDELRRKNRGEYTDARQDPYRVEPAADPLGPPPPVRRAQPSRPNTNVYGDIMD